MTAVHGCCLICLFSPAGILSHSFRVIQTLPHQINARAAVLQKVCAFIASTQTTRRLVRNIASMCSVSARAARSAVSVMATVLPGSNAKQPPRWQDGKMLNRCSAVTSVRPPGRVTRRRAAAGSAPHQDRKRICEHSASVRCCFG